LATRKPPGNAADSYEIYDKLDTPDGRVVVALTPAGEWMRIGAGSDYDTARDWAERITGLKVDRDLSGRGGRLKCRPR
jgi:hypothetical protein